MLAARRFIFLTAVTAMLGATPAWAQRAAPENVTATAMKDGAVISWRGIRDRSISYRVLRGTDPRRPGQDLTKPLPADATSYNDPQVAPGTTVFYTVVAVYTDGSEGASPPVQFTPAASAPMPSAQVSSRLTSGASPKLGPPVALRATPLTITGSYIWVTLSWPSVQTAVPEPVSYVVRRTLFDPASSPAGAGVGYVTGIPYLKADGSLTLVDRLADREVPTWYMVVATSTTQGSVSSPWSRRDPPLHHGVDTIVGSYWRVVNGNAINWVGCVKASTVPDAMRYAGWVRAGTSDWYPLATRSPNIPSAYLWNVGSFDTGSQAGQPLRNALEGGAQLQVQMWPVIAVMGGSSGQAVADTMHRQTAVVSVTQRPTPLTLETCS